MAGCVACLWAAGPLYTTMPGSASAAAVTYGVDQCRVCGKEIRPTDDAAMTRHLDSLKRKRPTMTEAEWYAAGLKAAPTPRQMLHPLDGCCYNCQYRMALRTVRLTPALLSVIGIVLFFLLTIFFLGSLFT